jgi:DNA-binding CsgD family transcriptional regulator
MEAHELGRFRLLLTALLSLIIVGGVVDLSLDRPATWLSLHVAFEVVMVAVALVTATALVLGWRRAEADASRLRRSLEERRLERDAWRASARKALEGLGEAIRDQFVEWGLTPAEREVALLLLKGYSHKAIARETGRSPETARQHASSAYRKSGLSGRAELAAFFLEDLMLPEEDQGSGDAPARAAPDHASGDAPSPDPGSPDAPSSGPGSGGASPLSPERRLPGRS